MKWCCNWRPSRRRTTNWPCAAPTWPPPRWRWPPPRTRSSSTCAWTGARSPRWCSRAGSSARSSPPRCSALTRWRAATATRTRKAMAARECARGGGNCRARCSNWWTASTSSPSSSAWRGHGRPRARARMHQVFLYNLYSMARARKSEIRMCWSSN
ncbi:hypothetical protein T492DRAFT_942882 [Pavlovales sp. CCMP2436]|nr:hypothetical protein T492DRAFT_942882 [Pavlovales sp. CCMP2436]